MLFSEARDDKIMQKRNLYTGRNQGQNGIL